MTAASIAQQGIWFTEQVVEAGSSYHIPLAVTFTGDLDTDAMLGACADVVQRHPLLGSALSEVDGELQVVPATRPVPIRLADAEDPDEVTRPFDLRHGPLARFTLVHLAPQRFRLWFTAHHAVFDGESKDVLVRDLAARYAARLTGTAPQLPAVTPYADHVAGERERVAGAVEAAKRYWAGRWRPAPVVLPGLTGEQTTAGGDSVTLAADPHLDERLGQRSKQLRASRFELLAAALLALLHRYGNAEPSVAVDVSTRTPAHRHAIGVFVNELPLSATVELDLPFRELAARVHTELRGRYAHWEVPPARVVSGVAPATSLAPVSLSYRQRGEPPQFPGVRAEVDWAVFNGAARNALHVQAVDGPDGLTLSVQYSRHRLDPAQAQRIARHLAVLLAGAVADPDTAVGDLPMLDPAEFAELSAWNDTAAEYPADTTLHELVAAQAKRTPDAVAVCDEDRQVSYADLDARANRVAYRLRALGAGPGTRVAVCAQRSVDLVVGLLGVLKSGAAYVPLDPEYPPARLEFMLADAAPAAVLTQRAVRPATQLPTLVLDADDLDGGPANDPHAGVGPEDAAYVIYTSGSTGRPKGVVNTHRGIVNRLHWMQREYGLTPEDAVLQKTPVSFDVSVWELFWPLITGARLVMARPGGHKDASYLRETIAAQGITTVHFVPSMLAVFLAEEGTCPSLRRVICSGEELPADLARRFVGRFDAALHNLYGPTEAAIDVSHWHCRPDLLDGLARVPIGRPIDNIVLYVLDARLQRVPVGVAGELHIGGVGLAREYLGRPELTAQRFVPDPYGPPGARLYKTGDLARYRPDGALEFLGRIDTQVKIRGQRVELGEIEAALRDQPTVRAAAIALREDTPGDQRLVAYVVPASGTQVRPDELRTALRHTLPDYMVPAAYVPLDALPVTPNGKLDRAALPAPAPVPAPSTVDSVEQRTDAERLLAQLWQEVLGVDRVGIDDDFFDLGGHSLLATRVVSRLRRALPPDAPRITVMDLFAQSTIRELAALIEPQGVEEPEAPQSKRLWRLTPARGHTRLSLVCVPYGGSSAVVYQPLADALPGDCALYAVAPPGHDLGVDEDSRPLGEVAQEVCTAVLSTVDGPLVLYGHCVGSALTIEIARRLEAAGRTLEAVYIGGSFPFALPRRGVLGAFARLSRLERLRSDRYWANWLRSMGADLSGLPAEDVMRMVQVMRGDARDGEDYFTELLEAGAAPLRAPIISVVGERDPITEYYQERYREWHFLTGTAALVVLDEGGHYFLRYRQEELAAIVTGTHEALVEGTTDRLTAGARGPGATWWLGGVSTGAGAAPRSRAPQPSLRRFLTVASGQLCSITGSALTEFAVPLWIYLRTGSLKWYALAWIVGMLGLLVAPVAGAVVDRCNRRMVMLASDSAAGLGQGVFAVLVLTGHLRMWEIWVVLGWLSLALTFQRLAYASAVPQLVPKHFLGHANGVVQLTIGVAQFVVPLIAAAMLAAFDLSGILLFDLVSFVIAVATVAMVRFPATMPHRNRESLAAEIVNGWRYSMGNRYFRGMLGYMGLLNVFLSALILLIFPLVLSFGSLSTLGTVSFIGGAGAALGGLAMALWGGPKRRRMYGMLVSGVLLGGFGMVAGLRPSMPVAAVGLAGMFFWLALVNGVYATIVQVKVPQRYHGRVFALNQMIAWSTIPLGLVLVAPLATRLFEPMLAPGGALAGTVGRVIGVGPGRGIGFAYLVLGLVIVVLTLACMRTRILSRFDAEVPDALPDDVIGLQALRERHPVPRPRAASEVREVSRV